MAYANPLDPTTPADTDPRAGGAFHIRMVEAAIRERLLTVFQDLDADPLQFIGDIIPTAAIAAGAIDANKLAVNAVTTVKILDAAVTKEKIPDNELTKAKVKDHANVNKLAGIHTGTYTVPGGGLSVPANGTAIFNIVIAAALVGDFVALNIGSTDANLAFYLDNVAAGAVQVRVRNFTGAPIVIPAGSTFSAAIVRGIG